MPQRIAKTRITFPERTYEAGEKLPELTVVADSELN